MSGELQEKINEVVSICKRIIARELDLIEGCRLINDLHWDLDNDGLDDRFDYFVQFERKCYEIPPQESRSRWSQAALGKYDAQAEMLRSEYTDEFLGECTRLIVSYENAA